MRSARRFALLLGLLAAGACSGRGEGEVVRVHVRPGATFGEIADSLDAKGVVRAAPLFRIYARVKGSAGRLQPGTYGFRRGTGWDVVLDDMKNGRVMNARLVVPEGFDARRIADAIARATGLKADSVLGVLLDTASATRYGVPGPTLEGYLYPATYSFPVDAPLDTVVHRLVRRYEQVWTPERRARADSIGMSEREVVTLASIVEREAKKAEEMPTIASVYHNRLRIGYPLQADPTVQYALGEHQNRLMYSHIRSVAEHPYNTYTQRGLPPGAIGSPSDRAIDAVLKPAQSDYLYFVARTDGSHVFTRSLEEHNRAKAQIRRQAQEPAR